MVDTPHVVYGYTTRGIWIHHTWYKMRRQQDTFTLTHDATGKTIRALVLPRSQGGKFMKIWQDTGWEQHLGELHGESLKLLWHLVMVAGWANEVPGPSATALVAGKRQSHISRAYTELVKAGFLYKVEGTYRLSPLFCWKGDEQQYEQAVLEFSNPKTRLLTLAASAVKGLV